MAAVPPLSRLYLLPAVVAATLGVLSIRAHLRQPKLPPVSGLGCVLATIPGPDTLHVPSTHLELEVCPHISETTLQLDLQSPEDDGGGRIFTGTGPEDPRRWASFLKIRWLGERKIEVSFNEDVRFIQRTDSVGSVRIRYLQLDEAR